MPRSRDKSAGFTLAEVLIALLIFSIAIIGLMEAGSQNARALSVLEQKQIAGIVADNQLVLALSDTDGVRPGAKSGSLKMSGRDWEWQLRTEATDTPGFFRLVMDVRQSGSQQIVISRTAFASGEASL